MVKREQLNVNEMGEWWIFAVSLLILLCTPFQELKANDRDDLTRLQFNGETASWMSCFHRPNSKLNRLTLKDICIPGSHDAGAYQVLSENDAFAARWVITQKLTIQQQLEAGTRRLDLRVMKVSDKENRSGLDPGFYIHHGGYATVSFEEALKQIKSYLDSKAARSESVILEFTHFRGFDRGEGKGSDYATFLSLLEKSIGKHLLERSKRGTKVTEIPLSQLAGKAILVVRTSSFFKGKPKSKFVHRRYAEFPIYDRYANKDKTDLMIADQSRKFREFDDDEAHFILNWTLTPQPSLRFMGGVSRMATKANAKLLKCVQDPALPFGRPNRAGHSINIINLDFYGVEECDALEACFEIMRGSAFKE